jgi:hypothetical protein
MEKLADKTKATNIATLYLLYGPINTTQRMSYIHCIYYTTKGFALLKGRT